MSPIKGRLFWLHSARGGIDEAKGLLLVASRGVTERDAAAATAAASERERERERDCGPSICLVNGIRRNVSASLPLPLPINIGFWLS